MCLSASIYSTQLASRMTMITLSFQVTRMARGPCQSLIIRAGMILNEGSELMMRHSKRTYIIQEFIHCLLRHTQVKIGYFALWNTEMHYLGVQRLQPQMDPCSLNLMCCRLPKNRQLMTYNWSKGAGTSKKPQALIQLLMHFSISRCKKRQIITAHACSIHSSTHFASISQALDTGIASWIACVLPPSLRARYKEAPNRSGMVCNL